MIVTETIKAWGHPNIRATHKTTLEITSEPELTPRGDCIIGVKADKTASDLSPSFKNIVSRDDAVIVIVFEVNGLRDIVLAHGSSNLKPSDPRRIIVRKSTYVEPATIAVKSNKAAGDINRLLIEKLKSKNTLLVVKLYAFTIDYLEQLISTNIVRGR